jgi:hypothetical protein
MCRGPTSAGRPGCPAGPAMCRGPTSAGRPACPAIDGGPGCPAIDGAPACPAMAGGPVVVAGSVAMTGGSTSARCPAAMSGRTTIGACPAVTPECLAMWMRSASMTATASKPAVAAGGRTARPRRGRAAIVADPSVRGDSARIRTSILRSAIETRPASSETRPDHVVAAICRKTPSVAKRLHRLTSCGWSSSGCSPESVGPRGPSSSARGAFSVRVLRCDEHERARRYVR